MSFARFDYTALEGHASVPVYVNPQYVAAVKKYDDKHTSIWLNATQYPILVDQGVAWVKEALEHAGRE